VETLGLNRNSQLGLSGRVTFGDLAQHYINYELGELAEVDDQKSHTTIERYLQILNNRLIPRWGKNAALEIQPLEIMQWLKASKREEKLENPTVDKIRRVMNLVFKHGQTYGLIPRSEEANPMKFVRVKTQSEYEAKIITPDQCFKILMLMPQPERTLTLLIAATGLRISECLGLQWLDVDYESQQIFIRRSWTGGKVGKPKTASSKAPVPMVPLLAGFIRQWQEQTPYGQLTDWVFASTRLKGKRPRVANMLVEDYLRPAAVKVGVLKEGEKVRFGFHNLRHSLASFLVRKGTDVEDGAKDAPPQRRYYHAGNLRSQHERGPPGSAGRDARGDDDTVKRGELSHRRETHRQIASAWPSPVRNRWDIDIFKAMPTAL
jgi:integrase